MPETESLSQAMAPCEELKRVSVLVVDDDPGIRGLLREYLDASGRFIVAAAGTAEEAFHIMVAFTPDVVVLDVCLPDMDGIDIIFQIQDLHPGSQIVMLTGHGTPERRESALKRGAVRFLEKPVDLAAFQNLLLDLARGGGGLEGGMDLLDLIQMMSLCRKTTTLRFTFKDQRGTLRFENGELVYADDGTEAGMDAFKTMTHVWGEGRFHTLPSTSSTLLARNIWLPTDSLILECAILRDTLKAQALALEDLTGTDLWTSALEEQEGGSPQSQPETVLLPTATETILIPDVHSIPETPKEGSMAKLKEILQTLLDVDGTKVAVVVDWDGFVIEGAARDTVFSMEAIGAVISTSLGSTHVIGRELNVGDVQLAMFEFDQGTVLARIIGTMGILAVLVNTTTTLGLIRHQIRKVVPDLEALLK